MTRRYVAAGLAAVIGALSVSQGARAEASASDKAMAENLFDEGRKLMLNKQLGEACPKLEASQRLDPAVGTLLNLARCYEESNLLASAWSTYREAGALARDQQQGTREEYARNEAKRLEPKLARLQIDVTAPTEGLEVVSNGKVVPSAAYGVPTPVDEGRFVIEARAPGKATLKVHAEVKGKGVTVQISVGELADAPADAPASSSGSSETSATTAPAPASVEQGSGGPPALFWVLGSVGIAAAATGSVFLVKSQSENSEAEALCTDPTAACTGDDVSKHRQHQDSAEKFQTFALVGFGVASAALIGSAVVWLAADGKPEASAQQSRSWLWASPAPGGANVTGGFAW